MHCPASDIGLCRCMEGLTMLTHADTRYYPKAGCFSYGRQLYSVRRIGVGRHFWEALISNKTGIIYSHLRHNGKDRLRTLYCTIKHEEGVRDVIMTVKLNMYGLPPIMQIWGIQRQMRRFLQRQSEERSEAVMMALHARLGCSSHLGCLPEDAMMIIL